MKVVIIKEHSTYTKGTVDVTPERANYLIRVGVAKPAPKKTKK